MPISRKNCSCGFENTSTDPKEAATACLDYTHNLCVDNTPVHSPVHGPVHGPVQSPVFRPTHSDLGVQRRRKY